mgnify:CR=1 FL=1
MSIPKIVKIEAEGFTWEVAGLRHGRAFHYDPESTLTFHGAGIKVYADNGAVGEYAGWRGSAQGVAHAAQRYLGENPLDRERFYQRAKRDPATAVYDIALWDLAGKMLGQPIHALIGTYRTEVPGYASTVDGAVTGPLSTPEGFADFAEQCLEMGYRGFKMHPMAWPDVQTHVDAVLALLACCYALFAVYVRLFTDRSTPGYTDLIVAILGCLLAGRPFIPVGKYEPPSRVSSILTDAGVTTLITSWDPPSEDVEVIRPGSWAAFDSAPPPTDPRSLAYIIYTSGSTGKPKGVQIEHRSAVNFLNTPDSILVRLPDGLRKPARLVATDHNRMLVLLKI